MATRRLSIRAKAKPCLPWLGHLVFQVRPPDCLYIIVHVQNVICVQDTGVSGGRAIQGASRGEPS